MTTFGNNEKILNVLLLNILIYTKLGIIIENRIAKLLHICIVLHKLCHALYIPEPCIITYMGDGYLVHPVQIYVPMNNRVIPSTRSWAIPGTGYTQYQVRVVIGYWWYPVRVVTRYKGVLNKSGYQVPEGYLVRVVTGYQVLGVPGKSDDQVPGVPK